MHDNVISRGRIPNIDATTKSANIISGTSVKETGNHQRLQKPDAQVTIRTEETADSDENNGISTLTASASVGARTRNSRLKKFIATNGATININFRNLLMLYTYDA
jgi:hypothetical protein